MLLRRFRLIVIAAFGLCFVVLALWGAISFLHPSLGPSIKAVSRQRLAEAGIVLINPLPWDQPSVSQAVANQLAIQQGPGGPVLQSVLAEVVLTNPTTRQPRLCWVVSLPASSVSSHGPSGSTLQRATFYLVLIDAHTGQFVEGDAGN